jgi:hypothetical protein
MAKLYLKLFPKLVSSLAVLLLCQFGYVACQSTGFSDSRLPEREGTHARYTFPSTYLSFSNYIQKKRKKFFYLLSMSFSFNIF